MPQIIALLIPLVLIPLVLILFWLWMFNDMLNNDNIPSAEPPGFRWPPVAKNHRTIFLSFSIFLLPVITTLLNIKNRRRSDVY